jgi:hypothetical protein
MARAKSDAKSAGKVDRKATMKNANDPMENDLNFVSHIKK